MPEAMDLLNKAKEMIPGDNQEGLIERVREDIADRVDDIPGIGAEIAERLRGTHEDATRNEATSEEEDANGGEQEADDRDQDGDGTEKADEGETQDDENSDDSEESADESEEKSDDAEEEAESDSDEK